MRIKLAYFAARLAVFLSQTLLKRTGGVIGGRVLLKLAPGCAAPLAKGRRIVLISGTNGKSTTTAMTVAAVGAERPVATNADGSNTQPGIVWTLASKHENDVVLETDEAWMTWAIENLKPAAVVLLNLSRDQLHRNPEVHRIARIWRDALPAVPMAIANADDPAVAWAANAAQGQTWVAAGQQWTADSVVCPQCGDMLQRDGEQWWSGCGLSRPKATWSIEGDSVVSGGEVVGSFDALPGAVNVSNAAMAVAAAAVIGGNPVKALAGANTIGDVAGRYAQVQVGQHNVRMILAKNPAGWQTAMDMVASREGGIALAFNAAGVDGRDPSWLYDVDFEPIASRAVSVCGERATEMTVRLEIDGAEPRQFDDLRAAIGSLPPGEVDLVANYSAFQQARRELGA
ncbi:MAG TPA: MurT ligase domain-containing protein [Marmoricola sp.]|nr:MurT ligase domain-containing protein [Marmoricola sp.]